MIVVLLWLLHRPNPKHTKRSFSFDTLTHAHAHTHSHRCYCIAKVILWPRNTRHLPGQCAMSGEWVLPRQLHPCEGPHLLLPLWGCLCALPLWVALWGWYCMSSILIFLCPLHSWKCLTGVPEWSSSSGGWISSLWGQRGGVLQWTVGYHLPWQMGHLWCTDGVQDTCERIRRYVVCIQSAYAQLSLNGEGILAGCVSTGTAQLNCKYDSVQSLNSSYFSVYVIP